MTDAGAAGGAEGFGAFAGGVALFGATTGAGSVVFGGIGEDGEFFLEEQT